MNKSNQTLLFTGAVLLQALILAAVPAKQMHARWKGTLITIKTAPVDPYDFLSGYHVVLGYEISQIPKEYGFDQNVPVFVILQKGPGGLWSLKSIEKSAPTSLPPDQIFLRGRVQYDRIEYGVEHYFIPEEYRGILEQDLRENRQSTFAQIKVDSFGNAALVRLLVGDKTYEY